MSAPNREVILDKIEHHLNSAKHWDSTTMTKAVPAELIIERPDHNNHWRWSWSVCQPDANWGEWDGGFAGSQEEAWRRGREALTEAHRQQGIFS